MTDIKSEDIVYIGGYHSYLELKKANVYWQPNKYCNYECSYCWPGSHTKVKDFDDKDKAFKTIDDLCNSFYERGIKEINWGWSGGEATFHPNFLDFQERILSHQKSDLKMTFNMTTNLSQSLKWWEKFVKIVGGYKYRAIAASLHQEYVNTEKQIDLFGKKLKFLKDSGIYISINQVMDIDLFDDQLDLLNDFADDGYEVSPKINTILNQLYYKFADHTGYTKEQMDYMIHSNQRKGGNRKACLVKTKDGKSHQFDSMERLKPLQLYHELHDWICTAGYISIVIKNGKLRRGVGGCADDILGNLGDDIVLHDSPKMCTMPENKSCSCVADLKLPKWKEGYDEVIAKG